VASLLAKEQNSRFYYAWKPIMPKTLIVLVSELDNGKSHISNTNNQWTDKVKEAYLNCKTRSNCRCKAATFALKLINKWKCCRDLMRTHSDYWIISITVKGITEFKKILETFR